MVDPDTSSRILFLRLSALGDILFALPAFTRLREALPKAHLTWLVDDRSQGILAGHPGIDELLVFPRKKWADQARRPLEWLTLLREVRTFLASLRHEPFDLCLDFQGNLKSGLLGRLSGSQDRIGFAPPICKEGNHLLTTRQQKIPTDKVHRLERDLELLRALNITPEFRRPELPLSEEDHRFSRSALLATFPGTGSPSGSQRPPLVILHPGTSNFGEFKRWEPENFAKVARSLKEERECRILVTWGPGEKELAERVVSEAGEAACLSPKTSSLLSLCALIRQADLLIAADTGPLHIASIQGVPVVALFGPKDPSIYAPHPISSPVEVVQSGVACSPCKFRQCDIRICMTEIEPQEVTARASKILALL